MSLPTLTPLQLNRALLARQLLLGRKRVQVPAAIHGLAGLQSQEPKDPYVALWSRISAFRPERLRAAAAGRAIVRGSYLRCTIHTTSAEDFLAFRALLQPVIDREVTSRREPLDGFDPAVLEAAALDLMAARPMTARQMGEALAAQFPRASPALLACWARTRLALAMVPSEDRWGYPRPPRYLPAQQWLGAPVRSDATLGDLLLRGLAAIGPASAADLRTWSGMAGIGPVLEGLRPRLHGFRDEHGRDLFDLPEAPRPRPGTPAPVRLLPEFDNALLAHADRSRIVPAVHARRFARAANGRGHRAVLVDGFVRATWNSQCVRGLAEIEVTPFEPLSKADGAAVGAEAEALLRYLEPQADGFTVRVPGT